MLYNLELSYCKKNIKKYFGSVSDKKHLVYIWCSLNDVPFFEINLDHQYLIKNKTVDKRIKGERLRRKNFQKTILKMINKNVEELGYIKKYLSRLLNL